MDFKKRLRQRFYIHVTYLLIGLILICLHFAGITENDFISSLGFCFLVCGIAKIVQYFRTVRNKDALERRKIAETDERNIMIYTKARSMTFSVFTLICGISIIILYILNIEFAAQMIAYTLCAFYIIYLICYNILKKSF